MKLNDIRYLRTERLIFDAFAKLLSRKSYEKITVQDIAGEAMINRATFYAHYVDKDALLSGIVNRMITDLSTVIDSTQIATEQAVDVRKAEALLASYYTRIERNSAVAQIIAKSISQDELQLHFSRLLQEKYAAVLQNLQVTESNIAIPTDFVVAYMTSIFTGSLMWWIKSGFSMKAKELAHLVITLVSNGHLTVRGVQIKRD